MRKLSILLILQFLLIISTVTAADWNGYGAGPSNYFTANPDFYNNYTNTTYAEYSITSGDFYNLFVRDFEGDRKWRILTTQGNFVRLIETNAGGALVIADELLMNDSASTMGFTGDVDNDGDLDAVLAMGRTIYTITVDNGSLNITANHTIEDDFVTAIVCLYNAGFGSTLGCYIGMNNTNLLEYNPQTGGSSIYNSTNTNLVYDFDAVSDNRRYQSPYNIDLNSDPATAEMMLVYTANSGSSQDGFIVYQPTTGNILFEKNYTSVINTNIRSLFVADIDGVTTDSELPLALRLALYGGLIPGASVVVDYFFSSPLEWTLSPEFCSTYTTWDNGNNNDAYLDCYQADGSTFGGGAIFDNSNTGDDATISNIVQADVDGDSIFEYCVAGGFEGSNPTSEIKCFDSSLALKYSYTLSSTQHLFNLPCCNTNIPKAQLIAGRFTQEDRDSLFINGYVITNTGGSNFEHEYFTSSSSSNGFLSAASDVNYDGYIDIISSRGSVTAYFGGSLTNDPPELDNTLNYAGYGANVDYTKPVCVGTTVTYTAQECTGNISCNYNNDAPNDLEVLRSNCGSNSNLEADLVNGTSSYFTPSYSCFYNQTGIYPTRIYIEDSVNNGDLTQYNTETINVNVIDGIQGVTCNFAGPSVGETGADLPAGATADEIDASLSFTLDLLTGTDPTMKLIIGIGMIIGIVVGVAGAVPTMATSGLFMGIIAFLAIGFVSLFGFLSFWVMILLMAGCGLLILFSVMMGRGSQGG